MQRFITFGYIRCMYAHCLGTYAECTLNVCVHTLKVRSLFGYIR